MDTSINYEQTREVTTKQPIGAKDLVLGFRVDMPRQVADEKAEKINIPDGYVRFTLPSGVGMNIESAQPGYARDTLAELKIYFYHSQPADYTFLREMLTDRYQQPGFPHRLTLPISHDDVGDIVSFFDGPLEIQLVRTEWWVCLQYTDLRREQQHLKEIKEKEERERQEMTQRYRQHKVLSDKL